MISMEQQPQPWQPLRYVLTDTEAADYLISQSPYGDYQAQLSDALHAHKMLEQAKAQYGERHFITGLAADQFRDEVHMLIECRQVALN